MKRVGNADKSQKIIRSWTYGETNHDFGTTPLIMGIVNVTPDSFSDGGVHNTTAAAVEHALTLVKQGANILDIGGESTRPDADVVSLDEELARVVPVVTELSKQTDIPVSIDTTKAEVARQAIHAGATIVNDVSGLEFDSEMIPLCVEHSNVGIICMHMQGTPQTMQKNPSYKNVLKELNSYFKSRIETMTAAGIAAERIVLDPGIGFGKSPAHNVEILRNIPAMQQLGRPILIGHSRKRFIGKLLDRPVDERLWGTVGISLGLAQTGVDLIRVHDVQAAVDSIGAWRAVFASP